MSLREEFEEFCRRTRPVLSTTAYGWGKYSDPSTQAAWRTWRHLYKQCNPRPALCHEVKP